VPVGTTNDGNAQNASASRPAGTVLLRTAHTSLVQIKEAYHVQKTAACRFCNTGHTVGFRPGRGAHRRRGRRALSALPPSLLPPLLPALRGRLRRASGSLCGPGSCVPAAAAGARVRAARSRTTHSAAPGLFGARAIDCLHLPL